MAVQVVPLSQRSGIVEWCEGTVPLGEYLVHPRTGAHLKYHPHDWPSKLCRQKMEVRRLIDVSCVRHYLKGVDDLYQLLLMSRRCG